MGAFVRRRPLTWAFHALTLSLGVAVLTALVARFRVEVREEARFAGETFEARKARLLRSAHSLTV